SSSGVSDTTGAGGGYELGVAQNSVQVITYSPATGAIKVAVGVAATNIKIDVVSGREVWTNSNLAVTTANVAEIHALGIQPITLSGSSGGEKFFGNVAANTFD